MLKIGLAMYNSNGATAFLEDDEGKTINVLTHSERRNPKQICRLSAKKLRSLADAFDRLAEMDEPFKEKTHKRAMRLIDSSRD